MRRPEVVGDAMDLDRPVVEHAERHELLHDLGLDEAGVLKTIYDLVEKAKTLKPKAWSKELSA